ADPITEQQGREIVQALNGLRTAIEGPQSFAEIKPIRDRQVDFLRAAGKLPDFIEFGSDVWFGGHHWHVRHLQPIALGRDPSGHYTIALLQTQVVLRPENQPAFIGIPYDNRSAGGDASSSEGAR